ncbi:helix-turn-helix transcriptional regulator [Lysinibacillus fusiformis]|uniref:helix-turn-helix transcriptional regulator n=1 Tax=Lysinibacillus fusiformis TaxID=28031 RepID=UPI0038176CFD
MRKVRGVKELDEYLKLNNCPMSEATLYRLVKRKEIPFNRPAPRVLLFDLDDIDKWLGGETQ